MTLMCKKQHLHNEEEFYHAVKKQNILLFITSEVLLVLKLHRRADFSRGQFRSPCSKADPTHQQPGGAGLAAEAADPSSAAGLHLRAPHRP